MPRIVLLFALLAACDGKVTPDSPAEDDSPDLADGDGDGYPDDIDCAPDNPAIHPGALERCDAIDNNCDGAVDEGVLTTFYADVDQDGYGDPLSTVQACESPEGTVPFGTACDDGDPDAFPGGSEACDDTDNDCDSRIDEGTLSDFFVDLDGDGHGDPNAPVSACEQPFGSSTLDDDCDDSTDAIAPGLDERCDQLDNDCDSRVDEDPNDALSWYRDVDEDGFGDLYNTTQGCAPPTGYTADDSDCDDRESAVYPGAAELCDAQDNDCDSGVDEGVIGTGSQCPAEDCAEILADNPASSDGVYVLTRGNYTCDMSTDGGGWTRVYDNALVDGTTWDQRYYNSEGFTWAEVLFAYDSGSMVADCTYPTSMTGCLNLGFQFGAESWGTPANFYSTICGLATVDYASATSFVGGYDFTVAHASSADTIRLASLEAVSSCTTWDNTGPAYVDVLVRP